jgi:hypothetical protein
MFCPECKAEYRPGFLRCSDCDVALVDELPADEHVELVRLRSYATDAEAFLAQSVLQSAGVEAMVGAPAEPVVYRGRSFGIGVPATDVYVRSGDFVIANEILNRAAEQ